MRYGPRPQSLLRRRADRRSPGHHYSGSFVTAADREEVLSWLRSLHPIWEQRFGACHPPPEGQPNRTLLRPVYWLGNWQFACLDYYHPPKGVKERCVRAEPFPPVLARMVEKIEAKARTMFRAEPEMPKGWHLNTCLVNFYGNRLEAGKWVDTARVGEHRDFEPGPVASVSFGERALLQFVTSRRPGERDDVVLEQWLDDRSLQLFGGPYWKDETFHRVQRVDKRAGHTLPPEISGFKTRRVNLTFRFVPDRDVIPFAELSKPARDDVRGYVSQLAEHSDFFRRALAAERP